MRSKPTTETAIKSEVTCVQLSKETRDKLAKIGTMDDTYESVILRLMKDPSAKDEEEGESISE